jgi:hypothetical protein
MHLTLMRDIAREMPLHEKLDEVTGKKAKIGTWQQ